jgi:catechol 2,3-dioxygenase-like lactoylglutathione lyase family enzyme
MTASECHVRNARASQVKLRCRGAAYCRLAIVSLIFHIPLLAAQSQAKAQELAGIAHIAIRVADLDKSRAFYEKLGFQEAFAMDQGGTPTQSFVKINDRQFIELYPQREPSQAIGFMHVCFEADDLEALNRFYGSIGLSPISVRRAGAGNLLFTMHGPEAQNIEYTQYMPGSKHWNDRGKHLGARRISEEMIAVGIAMQDTAAARTFYEEKLGFTEAPARAPNQIGLRLPGASHQRVEILQQAPGAVFQVFFAVDHLRRAAAQLKAMQIPVEKQKTILSIKDPDGNRIVFEKRLAPAR